MEAPSQIESLGMHYELEYDATRDLIICRTSGTFNIDVAEKMTADFDKSIKLYKCNKILIDLRELDIGSSVFDIYDFQKIVRHANIPFDGRLALVVTQITENYHVFETDSVDMGQHIKFFSALNKAVEWLQ